MWVQPRHLSHACAGNHFQKFYWGDKEIMMPVLTTTEEALRKHPEVDVFVNFASFRSVYATTMEALSFPQIKTVSVVACLQLTFCR